MKFILVSLVLMNVAMANPQLGVNSECTRDTDCQGCDLKRKREAGCEIKMEELGKTPGFTDTSKLRDLSSKKKTKAE